jgi:uncharacterized repeat protein (TIGR02543 family)
MTKSGKHSFWKFLILGMICAIITVGSFAIWSSSKPDQTGICGPKCHAYPSTLIDVIVDKNSVAVYPDGSFTVTASYTGGADDGKATSQIAWPVDAADNALFVFDPEYSVDTTSPTDSLTSTITAPTKLGDYTIRVYAADGSWGSISKEMDYEDIAVTVTAPTDQYTLTINTVGSGSVTKNPDQATYASGTSVELTATADAGWEFSGWSGDLTGSTNPDTITMNSDKTVTATFTEIPAVQYTLTISVVGSGTTDPAVGVYTYDEGTLVSVTATPDSGWLFDHWELDGGPAGSANPIEVTMDNDHSLTAFFTEEVALTTLTGVGRKPGALLPGDNLTLKAHVKNYGNLNVIFYAEFVIKDPFGDEVGRVNTTEAIELVGNGALWVSATWQVPGGASSGTYAIEGTLYYKAVGTSEYTKGNTLTSRFKVRA